jgi:ribosomal protein S18 acetylase RimI-like enzyme
MPFRKADIRPFRSADEPLLFGLAKLDRGADERTLAVLEHETVFVAEVEGALAGYVALEQRGSSMRVEQLFVSPEREEEEEVGGQLLDYAEGYAILREAKTLQVVVEPDNAAAHQFYHGRGFVAAGEDVFELVLPQRQ